MSNSLQCPKCGTDLNDAMQEELRKQIRAEFGDKFLREKKKIEDEFQHKEKVLAEELAKQKRVFEMEKKGMEDEMKKALEARIKEQFTLQLQMRDEEIAEKNKKIQEKNALELEFMKKQREWHDEKERMEVEIEKRLIKESTVLQERAQLQIQEQLRLKEEQSRLRDAEKDKKIEDMQKLIEDLQRKSQQGSQQLQGEVAELELAEMLRSAFRYDDIADVPKGVRGADIIQTVQTQFGVDCGKIIWESKRTKAWSNEWITKLKEDQRSVKAAMAVIISTVLPKGVERIGNVDGVWVTDFSSAIGLAMALRQGLIDVSRTKSANEGRNEKMEMVYGYLAGEEFRQKIQAIVESFMSMKNDLDKEKIAMNKLWAQREKSIERIMINTTGMFGDIQGIIGGALQGVSLLELDSAKRD